jgi:hypothetical protein
MVIHDFDIAGIAIPPLEADSRVALALHTA